MKVTGDKTFPYKLYDMLEEADLKGFADIVSWLPNRMSFQVHDVPAFVEKVLPQYFGSQTHFRSFQRQLNLYSFVRHAAQKADKGCYSHTMLRRGDRHSCGSIRRKKARIKSHPVPLEQPILVDFNRHVLEIQEQSYLNQRTSQYAQSSECTPQYVQTTMGSRIASFVSLDSEKSEAQDLSRARAQSWDSIPSIHDIHDEIIRTFI